MKKSFSYSLSKTTITDFLNKLLAGAALIMLGFSVPALAYTQNDTFVIGSVHKKAGKVRGAQAYLTTPNTGALFVPRHESMTYAATDGNFALVEAGAYENNGALYHPYTKWIDVNGIEHFWNGNDNLFPGGWYLYRVQYVENGMWRAEWMDGNNVWHVIKDANLGIFHGMNNFGAGGYSDGCCAPFGNISTSMNRWIRWKDGAAMAYYYKIIQNNVPNNQGAITPCGANNDWDVSY